MTNINNDVINLVGIQNESVLCYITTAIQFLYSIKEIREYFLETSFNNKKINNNNIKSIIKEIFIIINNKIISNNKSFIKKEDIKPFYENLYLLIGEHSTNNLKSFHITQGDVTEILIKILDILPDNIKSNFMINILDKTICEGGKNNDKYKKNHQGVSTNIDMLILKFPDPQILYNPYELTYLIDYHTQKEEFVEPSKLADCNGKGYTKIDIENTQKYLFITLSRIIFINSTQQIYNTTPVNVTYNLEINKYNYKLIGMILKSGTATKGHFIYCTMKGKKPHKIYDNDNVYTIIKKNNDNDKDEYNVEDVKGKSSSYELFLKTNSYVLLYTKIVDTKPKPNNTKKELDIKIISELNDIILDRINILEKNIKTIII